MGEPVTLEEIDDDDEAVADKSIDPKGLLLADVEELVVPEAEADVVEELVVPEAEANVVEDDVTEYEADTEGVGERLASADAEVDSTLDCV